MAKIRKKYDRNSAPENKLSKIRFCFSKTQAKSPIFKKKMSKSEKKHGGDRGTGWPEFPKPQWSYNLVGATNRKTYLCPYSLTPESDQKNWPPIRAGSYFGPPAWEKLRGQTCSRQPSPSSPVAGHGARPLAQPTPTPAPCPNRRPAHAVRPSPLPILPSSHAPTLPSRIRLLIQATSGAKGLFDTGAPWSKLEEYVCSWPRRIHCFHSPFSSSIVVACGSMVGCWTAAKQPSQRKKLNDAFLVCFSQAANLVRTPSRLTSQVARFGFVCMAGMACENLDVKGDANINPIRNLDLAGRIRRIMERSRKRSPNVRGK